MYSGLVFFLTLLQLVIVFGSQAMGAEEIFSLAVIYGSPLYLVMNLIKSVTSVLGADAIYIMLLAYHLFKYVLFFCAQLRGDRNFFFFMAIIFEAIYLGISGYYLN